MATDKAPGRMPVCKHIRSQESFFSATPQLEDDLHSGLYWCDLTSDGMGPDGQCTGLEECSSGRECFQS